jgi:hypothetical protein
MGPVAQRVFKTRAVVQPTARSVRLRRRSVVGRSAAVGLASVALREDAATGGDRCLPREASWFRAVPPTSKMRAITPAINRAMKNLVIY